jgi:hypothetical protein
VCGVVMCWRCWCGGVVSVVVVVMCGGAGVVVGVVVVGVVVGGVVGVVGVDLVMRIKNAVAQ